MATLTAGISASATLLPVSAEVEIGFYTIDSENIYVTGMSRGADGRSFTRRTASVDRAVGGSTAATHLSGATLTRYYPDAAGGGGGSGVTVDNQSDPPEAVTTIVAPNATFGPAGTATLAEVLIQHETTGAEAAGVEIAALAEDGTATISLETYSNTSAATVTIAAGSGADSATINVVADDGATHSSYFVLGGLKLHFDNGVPITRPALPASPTEQDIADALVALGLCTQTP